MDTRSALEDPYSWRYGGAHLREKSDGARFERRLMAIRRVAFAADVAGVGLHGEGWDHQRLRDLFIGISSVQQEEYLDLAVSQWSRQI